MLPKRGAKKVDTKKAANSRSDSVEPIAAPIHSEDNDLVSQSESEDDDFIELAYPGPSMPNLNESIEENGNNSDVNDGNESETESEPEPEPAPKKVARKVARKVVKASGKKTKIGAKKPERKSKGPVAKRTRAAEKDAETPKKGSQMKTKELVEKSDAGPSAEQNVVRNARADDLGLPASASIAKIIDASIMFLAKSNGHSSLHEVRKYLKHEHSDKISLENHDEKIKMRLKAMFGTETIVPYRRNLKAKSVSVQFKLAPKNKKKVAGAAAKMPAKRRVVMADESDVDGYSDNEDVPPHRRI